MMRYTRTRFELLTSVDGVFRLMYNSTHGSLQARRKLTTLHCRNVIGISLQHGGNYYCRQYNVRYITQSWLGSCSSHLPA